MAPNHEEGMVALPETHDSRGFWDEKVFLCDDECSLASWRGNTTGGERLMHVEIRFHVCAEH